MKNHIKIMARPKLNSPNMLAAWPGVGNVSSIIASYMKKKLEFKNLGELEAPYFFDPIGVLVKDNLVEEPQFPQSKFYYLKNPKSGASDLILFIGDDQPNTRAYELANTVLDVAERFKVKRLYTCAAAVSKIHHAEQPHVWGVSTNRALTAELEQNDLLKSGNLHIGGLNGILLGVAKERGLDGICLLGEVPSYATKVPSPMAALAITRVLMRLLEIKVNLDELTQVATETQEKLKQLAAEAMEEYIDYFTTPIWEQGGEEMDEEDEDEDDGGMENNN